MISTLSMRKYIPNQERENEVLWGNKEGRVVNNGNIKMSTK